SSACSRGGYAPLFLLRSIASQQPRSEPTPINTVMLDQPVGDFHYFYEIYLVAIRRCARILPNEQPLSVGEPLPGSIPAYEVIGAPACALLEEVPHFRMTPQRSAPPAIEDGRHEWAFQNSILCV